jgi:hypothetical protein
MKARTSELRHSASRKQKPTTKKGKTAKVKKVMHEWKEGELKTNAGKIVEDQKQAVAIALSESGQSYKDKKKGRKKKG